MRSAIYLRFLPSFLLICILIVTMQNSSSNTASSRRRARPSQEIYKPRRRTPKAPAAVSTSYADVMNLPSEPAQPAPETSCPLQAPSALVTSSYADVMATSTPDVTASKSAESVETPSSPKSSPSLPKAIESQHAPGVAVRKVLPVPTPTPPPTSPPAAAAKKAEPPAPSSESVLFAPAETQTKGVIYGGWKNLKGDPEKLKRLNKPSATPLESRWAC
jgi:hypothetical protein